MWFYFGTWGMPSGMAPVDGWIALKTDINTSSTPMSEQYLEAFYWSITVLSTVGFGDVTPVEKVFSVVAELVGTVLFAMLMGGLAGLFRPRPLDLSLKSRRSSTSCGTTATARRSRSTCGRRCASSWRRAGSTSRST